MPRRGKTADLAAWLEERHPGRIGETEFAELSVALAPVSESYLRRLVRQCGVPLDPLVEGVRQGDFDELESSLLALQGIYETAGAARRQAIRSLVITAKDHARLAAKSKNASEAKRAEKDEMILWLGTWLENPLLFAAWVKIRRGLLLK